MDGGGGETGLVMDDTGLRAYVQGLRPYCPGEDLNEAMASRWLRIQPSWKWDSATWVEAWGIARAHIEGGGEPQHLGIGRSHILREIIGDLQKSHKNLKCDIRPS
jgi:hypothetical protein